MRDPSISVPLGVCFKKVPKTLDHKGPRDSNNVTNAL